MVQPWKIINYFTFREVIEFVTNKNGGAWSANAPELGDLYTLFPKAPIWTDSIPYKGKENNDDLFTLLFARYSNNYFAKGMSEQVSESNYLEMLEKLINIYVLTQDKYNVLINEYRSKKNALMAQIKSSSSASNRFNDTPQNGGEYEDDPHTSTYTKIVTENSVDGDSPISRLYEIKEKYSDLLLEWSNEFDSIFIEEGNI